MLKQPLLFKDGHYLTKFELPQRVKQIVSDQDWTGLDQTFIELTRPGGSLFNFLSTFHDFNSIEFIISIRNSENEWEEDGIWHDDGSRVFAFSLSLTLDHIEGGKLGIRKKGGQTFEISTPPFGDIILFLTGVYGYEHKIHAVTKGKRVIIAGWCS